jgi:hypothetical protein
MTEPVKEELPFKMERFFHRDDYKDGKLTIIFENAGHLADTWYFAQNCNKSAEFNKALMGLIRMALGSAVPQKESTWPDGTHFDATPGRDHKIHIYPDSLNEPSFYWQEKPGMVGGLIWHHTSGEWSIHT